MKIYTTELIKEIDEKENRGESISRYDKIYFQNNHGVRKAGIDFAMTSDEVEEYIKCKLSIYYFAEHYCKIKFEDGHIGQMELREYQKEILKLYTENRYSILMSSRQVGKTISAVIFILHMVLFQKNKGIMIVANKMEIVKEIIRKIKNIYKLLPFFMKTGVTNWNEKYLCFENGSRIQSQSRTKEPAIGHTIDLLYIDEFAKIPDNIIRSFYFSILPTILSNENSKIIITSTPDGYNLFYELLRNAELPNEHPDKNAFVAKRVYWWEVPGRRDTKIKFHGKALEKYDISSYSVLNFLKEQGLEIYEKTIEGELWYYIKYDINNSKTLIYEIESMLVNHDIKLKDIAKITNWKKEQICLIGSEELFKQEYDIQFICDEKDHWKFKNKINHKLNERELKNKIRNKLMNDD